MPVATPCLSSPRWRTVWIGSSDTIRITRLESDCAYAARIRTKSDQGYGKWSCSYKVLVPDMLADSATPAILAQKQQNLGGH